jgi:hypothetical protein
LTGGSLYVSLSGPAAQFGFDADQTDGGTTGAPFQVASVEFYSDASFTTLVDTYTGPANVPSNSFFGLQDSSAFQSVKIDLANPGQGFSPYLDDFQVSTASTPEPGTLAMLVLGGICALSLRMILRRAAR